jgi:hypothetical protein
MPEMPVSFFFVLGVVLVLVLGGFPGDLVTIVCFSRTRTSTRTNLSKHQLHNNAGCLKVPAFAAASRVTQF